MSFEFEVNEETSTRALPPIMMGEAASVLLPKPFIGRLTFLNEDGSGAAEFGDSLLDFRIGDGVTIRARPDVDDEQDAYRWIRDGITIIPKGTVIPAGTEL